MLNKLIQEYHKLYAKYRRPEYLDIARDLGKAGPDDFEDLWQKKVNAGCCREGIAIMYPNTL
jgi:hypothetical protein